MHLTEAMNRRGFLKAAGVGAAVVAGGGLVLPAVSELALAQHPLTQCGPSCQPPNYWQYLLPGVHEAYATRAAAQATLFKNRTLTNAYAATTSSSFSPPAITNLHNYGYDEYLRQQAAAYVNSNRGGIYGPLTQAQLNAVVAAGGSWGYWMTSGEANCMNGFLSDPQVSAGVQSIFTTSGGLYNALEWFQSFNTWVNWQMTGAALHTQPPKPHFRLVTLDEQELGMKTGCGAFISLADAMGYVSGIVALGNPEAAGAISAIGGFIGLTGLLCELAGGMYYSDAFVD